MIGDAKLWIAGGILLVLVALGGKIAWHEHRVGFDAGVADCAKRVRDGNAKGDDTCAAAIHDMQASAQAATDKRDTSAVQVAASTKATADTDVQTIKQQTGAAVQKVSYVTHTIHVPADCPGLPASVRDAGAEAVQRANAAQGRLRTGQH